MKKRGKPFEPGNSLGKGRPRSPEEIKGMASLTKAEATAALSGVLKLSSEELDLLLESKSATMLELWAARIAKIGIEQGDQQRLNFMFDRLIGKVPQPSEVKLTLPEPLYVEYADGTGVALLSEIKQLEEPSE